jgi:Carboxypeptidase regulatory-like domain
MACAITGRVTESTTGAPLTTPSLALHRRGVVGETPMILDESGRFSFSSLCAGEYSLSAYSDEFVYWYKSFTLSEGQSVDDLQVVLTRGGRIVGQMLDEDGRPPEQGLLTLLRHGERDGRAGLINVCGDLRAERDGLFQSPPLSSECTFSVLPAFFRSPPTWRCLHGHTVCRIAYSTSSIQMLTMSQVRWVLPWRKDRRCPSSVCESRVRFATA